jgi:membrane fusion protein (multidrug efflux system)
MPTLEDVSKVEISAVPDVLGKAEKEKKKKPNPVAVTAAILAVVLSIVGTVWWFQMSGREETDDAYVEGHISYVSSRIAGTVTKVLVDEHARVKTGQLLVVLDPKDQQAKLHQNVASLQEAQDQASAAQSKISQTALSAQGETVQAMGDISSAQADITSARAAVLQAKDMVHQCQAKVKEQRAQEEYARTDFGRYETAWANRAVTKQAYDKAHQNVVMAIAQREQAEENLRQGKKQELQAEAKVLGEMGRLDKSKGMLTTAQSVKAEQAVDEAQYKSSLASVSRRKADLDEAQLQLSYTQILAPVDGRVGKKSVEVGQRVDAGQALMSVVQDDAWIIANYKETQVGKMHVGQPVEIKIDSFAERTFSGKVASLGPASGAKFSMLPPDNATGNFTKIVQRIPVKIRFDENEIRDYKERIAPGMSCVVNVLTKK